MVATATPRLTVPYAGIATRGIALAIDAAFANVIVLLIAALLALVASLTPDGTLRPEWLVATVAAVGWMAAVTFYFALFWSTTGQTPGMRLMRLKVIDRDLHPPHLLRALLRVVGLALAIIPLFAGFLPVLFDSRRRGIHDMLASTTVIHVPDG
jgi:uncharacterized RDD family membrane protein YckC